MTLEDCVAFLTQNGYLFGMNNLPYLSRKFYQDVAQKDIGLSVVERKDVVVTEHIVKPKNPVTLAGGQVVDDKQVSWSTLYLQFILDSEIPRVAYTAKGGSYPLNHSTKPGREAFRAAMLEGMDYDSLLEKAKSYYNSTQMPVKVENFFKNEIWRNNFDDTGDSFAGGRSLE